ncbi:Uncharacterized protein APZ42_033755 [Daphnia magna]|uniref:Uncharacterized protein n=1 Tax=Daphnia magna TaxID=35525 RepID=A0A164KUS6_9CRUS|nr:Uncharacterized protein APZ42_033755 [Daphnia magna]
MDFCVFPFFFFISASGNILIWLPSKRCYSLMLMRPFRLLFFLMQMSFTYDAMLFVRLTRAAMTAESFLGFLFSRTRNRHNRMKYNHVIFG